VHSASQMLPRCKTIGSILQVALFTLRSQDELQTFRQTLWPLCPTDANPAASDIWGTFNGSSSTFEPRLHTVCKNQHRLGPEGEGGKVICETAMLRSVDCLLVSVGSNGQVEFESAVHTLAPHCKIDIWDGTLNGGRMKLRRAIPSYATFIPSNFNAATWQHYQNYSRVDVLKIDCEGCEWRDLEPWLNNVCTSQLLIEMHMTPATVHGGEFKRLLTRLTRIFTLFYGEPNMACGWRDTTTRACVELALVRRQPC